MWKVLLSVAQLYSSSLKSKQLRSGMHTLDHLVLKMKKGRIVEWNPYVTSESRCSVETKQKQS
jgi:hypothetical protein